MLEMHFITIFPELFRGVLETGVLGISGKKGAARYNIVNLRDFAVDDHGTVDDYPYGGGPGMIMMAPTIVEAVESVRKTDEGDDAPVVLLSPGGRLFDQEKAVELSNKRKIVFVCGRYKGVDERVNDLAVTESLSIGNYVVSGGELPALVIADAVVRHLPDVIGDERSRETDSFAAERKFSLDSAYYTRPPEYRGRVVPEVLLSGNHAKIDEWRKASALERTCRLRPDLLNGTAGDTDAGN